MSETNTENVVEVEKRSYLDYDGLKTYHEKLPEIAKTGNVSELNQTTGDVLVLKGGDAAAYAASVPAEA